MDNENNKVSLEKNDNEAANNENAGSYKMLTTEIRIRII